MQLRHVRYFVATAETGSVSAAATAVHVTQPALSRQLRHLEQDLGVTLFDRSAGRLRLNRTGRSLLPAARRVLDAADELQERAAFHADGGIRRVTIAAPTVTLTDVVSPFVATLNEPNDPIVDVRTSDGRTSAEMLRSGADLVIGPQGPAAPLRSRPLVNLPVWAFVTPTDPWAGRNRVTLDALLRRTIITAPPTFTARQSLDTAVAAAGASYSEIIETANGIIAQALAAAGRGVAVASDDPRFGLLPLAIDINDTSLEVRLCAAWDPRGVAAASIEILGDRLAKWVAGQYEHSAVR